MKSLTYGEDVISTGMPAGVGLGMKPQALKFGGVVELGIQGLGDSPQTGRELFRAALFKDNVNPSCTSRLTPDCDTMTVELEVDEIRLTRMLFLLALSVFINYLDRGNLSIAAPLLKNEFQLSATQLGVLLS